MRTKTLSTAAAILMLSGMPMGLTLAEQPTDPRNPNHPGTNERRPQDWHQDRTHQNIQRTRDLTRYEELKGSEIHNLQGETIASVRDLIVDRGTGEIKHVVVRSGSTLGMGGTHVAIPFPQFNWDSSERRLTLNYTEDQIQSMREFNRDDWDNVLDEDVAINHENAYRQLQDDRAWQNEQDQYQQRMQNKQTTELTGTVRRIRTDYWLPGNPTTVTLDTEEHGLVDVVLGPAWYSMGFNGSPMRDEQVVIVAAEVDRSADWMNPDRRGRDRNMPNRDNRDRDEDRNRDQERDQDRRDRDRPGYDPQNDRDNNRDNNRDRNRRDSNESGADTRQGDTRLMKVEKVFVARTMRNNRGEVNLRDDNWHSYWNNDRREPDNTTRRGSRYVPFRYVLLEDVVGKESLGRAEDCGEVQSAIIDMSGKHVAFLGVDSGDGLLGVGEETYLVPWNLVRVQGDGVTIDSSCSAIKQASPVPDELDELRDESNWQRAFRHFDVDEPGRYRNDMGRPMNPNSDRDNPTPRR